MELMPYLPEPDRVDVLEDLLAMLTIQPAYEAQAENLRWVLGRLPERLAEADDSKKALEIARVYDGYWRARDLIRLAPLLPEPERQSLYEEALEEILSIGPEGWPDYEYERAIAMAELVQYLPEPQRPAAMTDAANVIRKLAVGYEQARLLALLTPYMSGEDRRAVLEEALAYTRLIGDEQPQAETLLQLAYRLPETERPYVLDAVPVVAKRIKCANSRASVLSRTPEDFPWSPEVWSDATLPARLSDAQRAAALSEALAEVRSEDSEYSGAWKLANLGTHLEGPLANGALATARTITNAASRAHALSGFAAHLSEAELEVLLATVAATENDTFSGSVRRSKGLMHMAAHLARLPAPKLYPLWRRTLRALASRTRADLLSDVCGLSPAIALLGETEAVIETARAILQRIS